MSLLFKISTELMGMKVFSALWLQFEFLGPLLTLSFFLLSS